LGKVKKISEKVAERKAKRPFLSMIINDQQRSTQADLLTRHVGALLFSHLVEADGRRKLPACLRHYNCRLQNPIKYCSLQRKMKVGAVKVSVSLFLVGSFLEFTKIVR
jgi:hypothetical protein